MDWNDYVDVKEEYMSVSRQFRMKFRNEIMMMFWKTLAENYRCKAEQGDPVAQIQLGDCYLVGRGVEQDMNQAMEWYCKAFVHGDPAVLSKHGYCSKKAMEIERDKVKAMEWYRQAVEQNDARAQCNLGFCYEYGLGMKPNKAEALMWYRHASEQGNEVARKRLSEWRTADGDVFDKCLLVDHARGGCVMTQLIFRSWKPPFCMRTACVSSLTSSCAGSFRRGSNFN